KMPVLAGLQLAAPLVLLYTPPRVAVYRMAGAVGSIAMRSTLRLTRPALTGLQLPPLLVLLNRPPPSVPAYSVAGVAGSIARARTAESLRPALAGLQLAPPSVLR